MLLTQPERNGGGGGNDPNPLRLHNPPDHGVSAVRKPLSPGHFCPVGHGSSPTHVRVGRKEVPCCLLRICLSPIFQVSFNHRLISPFFRSANPLSPARIASPSGAFLKQSEGPSACAVASRRFKWQSDFTGKTLQELGRAGISTAYSVSRIRTDR